MIDPFTFALGVLTGLTYCSLRCAHKAHHKIVSLEIIGPYMREVVEGQAMPFSVVAKNVLGRVVPDVGVTVSAIGVVGTVAVADDGSAGAFVGASGSGSLVATDGKVTSPAFDVSVTPDNTPASLEIVAP